jgi:hypothetical protein
VEVAFAAWERAAWPHFEAAPRPPTHAPLATRLDLPLPEIRTADCASSVGSDASHFQSSVIRVTRTAGGWTRVLASSALVRRSVMRALLPREPALRPTPSTEPARFLDARAPVGSTPFDVCHADPPRVVTAGRAFTTNDPPTSDVPLVACRHPQPAPSGESSSYAPLSRSRPTTPSVLPPPTLPKNGLRHLPEAPVPPPFDDVSEEHLLARPALAPPR